MQNNTIHALILQGEELLQVAGIPDATLFVSILLAEVLGKPVNTLIFHKQVPVEAKDKELYFEYIQKAVAGMPLGYILGHQEFYGFRFVVSPSTLIPRPETEELVEKVLNISWGGAVVVDVGTGSGCIPCVLRKKGDFLAVYGCDNSAEAMEVAKKNASALDALVTFWQSDCTTSEFVDHILHLYEQDKVHEYIITANLPYIPTSDMESLDTNVKNFEPKSALDGGKEGTEILIPFLKNVAEIRKKSGIPVKIFLEIDPANQASLEHFFTENKDWSIEFTKDMSGHVRFVEGVID